MGIHAGPLAGAAAEEPQLPVGVEVPVANPASQVVGDPVDLVAVHVGRWRGQQRADLARQGFGDRLVGVEGQDPVPFRLGQSKVLLLDVSLVGMLDDPGTQLPRNLFGGVGAPRIDHHHALIGEADRLQAAADTALLVARDDAAAER